VKDCNLFDEVMEDGLKIWPWGRTTLWRFMKTIGFIYKNRVSYYEHTRKRTDVVALRDNYLEWIEKYRDEGYDIFYQDETWVFKNMVTNKVWQDTEDNDDNFRVPPGSGERSILCHLASESAGLLNGCMLLYRGKKALRGSDYHQEMCWDVFSDWCEKKVFPALIQRKRKAVLVLDRATYHAMIDDDDKLPRKSWAKPRLISCVERWGGPHEDWPEDWRMKKTKAQLLERAISIYPQPKYKIQKLADKFANDEAHIKIIFLPVAHPELNPIEMVWGLIKRRVASRNLHFSLSLVETETRKQLQEITPELFNKFVQHTLKEEQKYRDLTNTFEENEEEHGDESDTFSTNSEAPGHELISQGPTFCHVDGCVVEDRNTATGHVCNNCKRAVHSICCVRVLHIPREDDSAPLYCSDCYNK